MAKCNQMTPQYFKGLIIAVIIATYILSNDGICQSYSMTGSVSD